MCLGAHKTRKKSTLTVPRFAVLIPILILMLIQILILILIPILILILTPIRVLILFFKLNITAEEPRGRSWGGVSTYIYTYIYTYIHTYIHTYKHTYIHV